MNTALEQLAARLQLSAPNAAPLALTFGLACAKRVEHLLEQAEVVACLRELEDYLAGRSSDARLQQARLEASRLANQHRGSASIDGCGHAAVSATYGVAKALEGRAVDAASYCAYAMVYAGGGYAAVADRQAFEQEFSWQVACLQGLAPAMPAMV